jgi:hypothetical protein
MTATEVLRKKVKQYIDAASNLRFRNPQWLPHIRQSLHKYFIMLYKQRNFVQKQ